MTEMMLLAALALSMFGNFWMFTRDRRLKNVVQVAVDKAEMDRRDHVRIPFNQVLELGFSSRHGFVRDRKDFNRKPGGPHPATLSPARRRNLP